MTPSVYDPGAWALLYVPSYGQPYPHTPDEIWDNTNGRRRLPEDVFPTRQMGELVLANPSSYVRLEVRRRAELFDALRTLCHHPIMRDAGVCYTIHASNLFQRLLRWHKLRTGEVLPQPSVVRDLVEWFHTPGVLTYEERVAFSVAYAHNWVMPQDRVPIVFGEHISFERELQLLLQLCHLMS